MSSGDTLLPGVNTTIVSMVIVFIVLIILAVIIVLQSKILKLLTKQAKELQEVRDSKPKVDVKPQYIMNTPENTGLSKGETKLLGIENEEHVAVIMAAVSNAVNIPITALKIRSIKRVDNTLEISSKHEQAN